MIKLLLLYATLLVGLIFLFLPTMDKAIDFFPFSDMLLYPANYIYYIGEKAVVIIMAYIIANEATEYEDAIWVFFYLMVADLIDYLMCYGEVWFRINDFPVSMNVVKAIVFGGVIIIELWKKLTGK